MTSNMMDFLHFMNRGSVVQSDYGPGLYGMAQPPGFQSICPENSSLALLNNSASVLAIPQASLSRLTWQEIREDLVCKITFEAVIY